MRYLERFNNGDVSDAATFTHGLESPFFASGMKRMHKRSHKLCARRTQWVAQCDGTSIDIELVWVSTRVLQPRHWDGSEGFVHFVEVNIIDAHARALQRSIGGKEGLSKHDHRIACRYRKVMDARQWREIVVLECLFRRDHDSRAAITNLTGVGGRERAVFHLDFQLRHCLHAGVVTNALVVLMQCCTAIGGSAHDRDDFFIKRACVSSVTTALMASY